MVSAQGNMPTAPTIVRSAGSNHIERTYRKACFMSLPLPSCYGCFGLHRSKLPLAPVIAVRVV